MRAKGPFESKAFKTLAEAMSPLEQGIGKEFRTDG